MNNVIYVAQLIKERHDQIAAGGIPMSAGSWDIALACMGWPYVYSAWGAECTPAERQKRYGMTGNENIVDSCQKLNGKKSSCAGCKFLPDGQRTRCYDCRGFTCWVIEQATGFKLYGETCSSQWGEDSNWCRRGEVGKDQLPEGVLVNLFIYKGGKWTHTGFYYCGHTCECSSGVQYVEKMKSGRWTHWAVAKPYEKELKEVEKIPEGCAIVTGKNVAIRQDRSTKSKCLGRVKTGETVQLEPPPPEEWLRVKYKGTTGWMMREFLREE